MDIDIANSLHGFPMEVGIRYMRLRAEKFGGTFRCVRCFRPLDSSPPLALVAFGEGVGKPCAMGLTHVECLDSGLYPLRALDLSKTMHQHAATILDVDGNKALVIALPTDIFLLQPDGSIHDGTMSRAMEDLETGYAIADMDVLLEQIAQPPPPDGAAKMVVAGDLGTLSVAGNVVFDFSTASIEPSRWRARSLEAVTVVLAPQHPTELSGSETITGIESEIAAESLREIVEKLGVVMFSARLSGLPIPGRNDPCLCGSGRKFKHCCSK